MALKYNNTIYSAQIGRLLGNGLIGSTRSLTNKPETNKNIFTGIFSHTTAVPVGYTQPYAWILPKTVGGMGTTAERMAASGSLNAATLGQGYPITVAMNGTLSVTDAALGLIVSLEIALAASGTITDAELAASAALVASMSASGTLTNVQLGAIVSIVASLQASGQLNATALVGVFMEWNVGGPTELSAEGLAQAVWNYAASSTTNADSMKKELDKAKKAAENAFAVSS